MASAEEYHRYARECLESAARATSEFERNKFMDMARAWTIAALKVDGAPVTEAATRPRGIAH
jgi:hypothetical protein